MSGSPQPKKLTHKQELFVAAYLGEARGNATEAARIAGYKHPEASAKDNLRKPTILAHVQQKVTQHGITADAVLAELADVGFAEWRDFVEIVQRDKQGKPIRVKFDLTNKVKALELLGKHLQLFTEKQELNVNVRRHEVVGVPQSALDALFRPAERADA